MVAMEASSHVDSKGHIKAGSQVTFRKSHQVWYRLI